MWGFGKRPVVDVDPGSEPVAILHPDADRLAQVKALGRRSRKVSLVVVQASEGVRIFR
jgi:hypothetical protein